MWVEDDVWYGGDDPRSMEVNTEGFVMEPGFIRRREMADPKPEEIAKYREAVVMDEAMPILQRELDKMINTVQNSVFAKIRAGELTPEEAMSYWMEVHSIARLNTRLRDTAAPAQNVTETRRITNG